MPVLIRASMRASDAQAAGVNRVLRTCVRLEPLNISSTGVMARVPAKRPGDSFEVPASNEIPERGVSAVVLGAGVESKAKSDRGLGTTRELF